MSEAIDLLKKQISGASRRHAEITATARREVQNALVTARNTAWSAIGYGSQYECLSSLEQISMDEMIIVYKCGNVIVKQRIDCETPPENSDRRIFLFGIAVACELGEKRAHIEAFLESKACLEKLNEGLKKEKQIQEQFEKKPSPSDFSALIGMTASKMQSTWANQWIWMQRQGRETTPTEWDSTPNGCRYDHQSGDDAISVAPTREAQDRLQRQLDDLRRGRTNRQFVPSSQQVQFVTERSYWEPQRLSGDEEETLRRIMGTTLRHGVWSV